MENDQPLDCQMEDTKVENIIICIGEKELELPFKLLMNDFSYVTIKIKNEEKKLASYSKHLKTFLDFKEYKINLDERLYPLEFMNAYIELVKQKDKAVIENEKLKSLGKEITDIFDSVFSKNKQFSLFLNRLNDELIEIYFCFYVAQLIDNMDDKISPYIENVDDDSDED